ncbi:MAG: hypothetical protein KC449_23995 [Anaerolineales bacterium]|nr:hypothetical protein [Anaerolineales bacterium]MCB8939221.1 hypothetical protein [Ardenticatenaceae bacterium]
METKTILQKKHVVLVPCLLRPKKKKPQTAPQRERLSAFLETGRLYHPLCRQAFVEQVAIGYYAYEQQVEFRTWALAAAYAGAFGANAVERADFSYTMAVWQLSQRVGYGLEQTVVNGPTGRQQNIAKEMMDLTDINLWTRQGVAQWLSSIGY